MLKKILFGALTVLLALSLVGCGAKKDANADKKDAEQKAEVTVEGTADKAVLAYAQLHAYGMVEDENKTAAGLSDADIEKGKEQVLAPIVDTFKDYPLSDESISEMTDKYVEKLHAAMDIKATVKTEDKEHPVVEVTATTINKEGLAKVAAENSDLSTLANAYGELQAQGLTPEQLKESEEFQDFALESIDNFINEFPLNEAATMEFTCDAVKGADGKMYWKPQDEQALKNFVTGQK